MLRPWQKADDQLSWTFTVRNDDYLALRMYRMMSPVTIFNKKLSYRKHDL